MQRFVAVSAVGPSAVRNQGKGVLSAIRRYLGEIDLGSIPKNTTDFAAWLNQQTEGMLNAIEDLVASRPWGTARKALNLFLRACLYNHYLQQEYRLQRTEQWLEIPVDSVVARALKRKAGRGKLPRWQGLVNLTEEDNHRFQAYARRLAKAEGLQAVVHLDIYLWLANR